MLKCNVGIIQHWGKELWRDLRSSRKLIVDGYTKDGLGVMSCFNIMGGEGEGESDFAASFELKS